MPDAGAAPPKTESKGKKQTGREKALEALNASRDAYIEDRKQRGNALDEGSLLIDIRSQINAALDEVAEHEEEAKERLLNAAAVATVCVERIGGKKDWATKLRDLKFKQPPTVAYVALLASRFAHEAIVLNQNMTGNLLAVADLAVKAYES